MKIGIDVSILNTPTPAGVAGLVESFVLKLINNNKDDEIHLFIIAPRGDKKYFDKFLNQIDSRKVFIHQLYMFRKLYDWFIPLYSKFGIYPIDFKYNLDVFHNFDGWIFPTKAPLIATICDLIPKIHPEYHIVKNINFFNQRFEKIIKRAKKVICISESTRRDLVVHLSLNELSRIKVEVIYPGIKDVFFERGKQLSAEDLKKFDISDRYWLMVGTLEPRKNVLQLIRAYEELSAKINLPRLIIIGRLGWYEPEKLNLITKNKNITYLGYADINDLTKWYRSADAVLYPSIYEGFGLPVAEALACGTLVLTGDNSSLKEAGGEFGIYVNASDISSIKNGLISLSKIKRQERLNRVALGSRWVQKFNFDIMVIKYLECWANLT